MNAGIRSNAAICRKISSLASFAVRLSALLWVSQMSIPRGYISRPFQHNFEAVVKGYRVRGIGYRVHARRHAPGKAPRFPKTRLAAFPFLISAAPGSRRVGSSCRRRNATSPHAAPARLSSSHGHTTFRYIVLWAQDHILGARGPSAVQRRGSSRHDPRPEQDN